MGQRVAGALAGMWRGGAGPSHTALDTTFEIVGISSESSGTKETRVLRALLNSPDDPTTKYLITELVELLRSEGVFESGSDLAANRVKVLQGALAKIGADLSDFGQLQWKENRAGTTAGAPKPPNPAPPSAFYVPPTYDPLSDHPTTNGEPAVSTSGKIFIVYGHDMALRNDLQVTLLKWGLATEQIVILDDHASGGDTLIEKFEKHSAEAAFAIVLGSPDDTGHRKDYPAEAKPRARQNVVLEFGYFLGKLGRNKVLFIDGGIERPSDINGLLTVNTTDHDWKTRVARELTAAGLEIKFL
jgi:predicted nucleotide-binding protein